LIDAETPRNATMRRWQASIAVFSSAIASVPRPPTKVIRRYLEEGAKIAHDLTASMLRKSGVSRQSQPRSCLRA
jgi:predicted secreted protein